MVYKFDLICSLGGNCSVAHNLLIRNLRKFALPFDWTYIKNENAIYNLAECFKNNFRDFLLKENLQELVGEEYNNSHSDKVQYKDCKTGYYWVNHFNKRIEDFNDEYIKVKEKIDRRIKRLKFYIDKSEKILFILSTTFEINIESIQYLSDTLEKLYPGKNFYFRVIVFSSKENHILMTNNIEINYYKRNINDYDFTKTNYEWSFLDDLIYDPLYLTRKRKLENLFSMNRIKKGFMICFFPKLNTIFYIKLYLFGLRLQFSFGKNRI